MRTTFLALVLAATTLMTGCIAAPCDPPTVTIYWQLSDAAGNFNVSCDSVTTAFVDIYIDTLAPVRAPCSSHVATVGVGALPPGSYTATVEGIDADGFTIWSRDQFQVAVGECNADAAYTARPGEGTLALDYLYPAGATCNGGYMWYSLWDAVAGQTISAIYQASDPYFQTLYACGGAPAPGDTYQIQIAVPFGSYELDWMQEVVTPTTAPTPKFQACGPIPVTVTAAGVKALQVAMTPYTAACPPIQ